MPQVEIYVNQADIEAAKRIAKKMFPTVPEVEARFVIAAAADLGMEKMKVVWEEDKCQVSS
jgi:UTP-glucose-1-phosphate uridylyltransferase